MTENYMRINKNLTLERNEASNQISSLTKKIVKEPMNFTPKLLRIN